MRYTLVESNRVDVRACVMQKKEWNAASLSVIKCDKPEKQQKKKKKKKRNEYNNEIRKKERDEEKER